METISRSLLTFLLNSLWQIPLAAAVAALVCRLMRHGPASHRHAVWVAALAAAMLLPLASIRSGRADAHSAIRAPRWRRTLHANPAASNGRARALPAPSPAPPSRTISFAATTATHSAGRLPPVRPLPPGDGWCWASVRTVRIRSRARYRAIPAVTRPGVDALPGGLRADAAWSFWFPPQVSGPVTAGRAIILPESLLAESSEDVLTTAIGHEMAHIARRDFACNLLYEVLYLPIGFHPAAWLIQREIERTREMACDELVTHRLMDPGVYARSIMSIANGMMALPRPGYTLGVFDGDILEARIRRLVERPVANLKRARLLLASGLAALALCAVIASSLSLTARAQGGGERPDETGRGGVQSRRLQGSGRVIRERRQGGTGQSEGQAAAGQYVAAAIHAWPRRRQSLWSPAPGSSISTCWRRMPRTGRPCKD